MAAATALALAGAATAGIQAISAGQQKKKAEKAAASALAQSRDIISQGVVNQYSGLQAPTQAYDLATQQTQQAVSEGTRILQSGAETAIGGVGRLVQAAGQQGLQTAAKRAEAEFDVDKMQAAEQARIEEMKYQGLLGLSQAELTGAQQAAAEARQTRSQAIAGLTSSFAGMPAAVASDKETGDWGSIFKKNN
jgi:hypothetical protein